jgi:flavin-dependent dehydrogenase
MAQEQTYECDVLVIGSGASGMAAAVTAAAHGLRVLIAEKEPRFGGTTARSGGWLWIPGTSLAKSWGINEPPELARTCTPDDASDHAGPSTHRMRVNAKTGWPEVVDRKLMRPLALPGSGALCATHPNWRY